MAATAKGFRYPAGTDPVSQGDDAIHTLASDVDGFAGWLPVGGASGAVLAKTGAADYAAAWTPPHYVPPGGAGGQVLSKNSGADYDAGWSTPSGGGGGSQGAQLDRKTMTADSASISATSEAAAVTFITGNAVTFDGTEVKIEFFTPEAEQTGAAQVVFVLYRDSTILGQIGYKSFGSKMALAVYFATFDTPPGGVHTYKLAAFTNANAVIIHAGVGGSGNRVPAWLRVTRA